MTTPAGPSLATDRATGSPWVGGLCSLLAGGVPLLVYLRTMAPTVFGLDSAELTTGSAVLGIVHAPGAPLYLLLGHLFTYLPIGDVGYRVNLLSGCAAALAATFTFRILCRLTDDLWLSLATTWFFSFSYYCWITAVAAELYALHACMVSATLLLALRWRDGAKPRQLYGLAGMFGLGLGGHLALVLMAPGLAWLALRVPSRPWRQPRVLGAAAMCVLLGASIYAYLPIRALANPPMNYAAQYGINVATWRGFWDMVTARMFASHFLSVPLRDLPGVLRIYSYWLWSNFLNLGVWLGVLGLVADYRRRRTLHTGLLLMFGVHLGFFLTYDVIDTEWMYLPTYLIFTLWIGVGAQVAAGSLRRRVPSMPAAFGALFVLGLAVANLIVNFPRVNVSQDRSARQRGEAIFQTIEPDAVYIGMWADVPVLEYLQLVEHQRPDVQLVNLFFAGTRGGRRIAAVQSRTARPVYTSAAQWIASDTVQLDYVEGCGCYRVRSVP